MVVVRRSVLLSIVSDKIQLLQDWGWCLEYCGERMQSTPTGVWLFQSLVLGSDEVIVNCEPYSSQSPTFITDGIQNVFGYLRQVDVDIKRGVARPLKKP